MASSYPARGKSRGYVPPEETKAKGSAGRWIGAIVALLLVGLVGAWAMGLFGRRIDARIVEIRNMSDEMSKQMATGGPQNEDEAKAFAQSMGQIREKIQALPEDLRGQAFRGGGMGRGFQAAMQANMKSFFATPPAQREAELDRQIKREQMMQKAATTMTKNRMISMASFSTSIAPSRSRFSSIQLTIRNSGPSRAPISS